MISRVFAHIYRLCIMGNTAQQLSGDQRIVYDNVRLLNKLRRLYSQKTCIPRSCSGKPYLPNIFVPVSVIHSYVIHLYTILFLQAFPHHALCQSLSCLLRFCRIGYDDIH